MKQISTLLLFLGLTYGAFAQNTYTLERTLAWDAEPVQQTSETGQVTFERWSFKGAVFSNEHPTLPYFLETVPLNTYSDIRVELLDAEYERLPKATPRDEADLQASIVFQTDIEKARQRYIGKIYAVPMRKIGSQVERLLSFRLRITIIERPQPTPPQPSIGFRGDNTYTSALSDGEIYKIAVTENGIYKLDANFLADELGIDLSGVDPRTIKIYGNGGGMLPELAGAERIDDLEENTIQVVGEDDGNFDAEDYVLFYGQGSSEWKYDPESGTFAAQKNIYTNENYYFLKISPGNGKRIATQNSLASGDYTTTTFDDFQHFEEDKVNLLDQFTQGQGSGKRWYGDQFRNIQEYTYGFTFPNIVVGDPVHIQARMASRDRQAQTFSILTENGQSFQSETMSLSSISFSEPSVYRYADVGSLEAEFEAPGDALNFTVRYTGDDGWFDFLTVNARRELRLVEGEQLDFRDHFSTAYGSTTYQLNAVSANTAVWEITDPLQAKLQEVRRNGTSLDFSASSSELREFIAFDANQAPAPTPVGRIENQNLHGLDGLEMAIIFHKDFTEQAARLLEHRRSHSNLAVDTVRIDLLYNEFSSGKQDPVAVRDFAKMLYDRTPDFQFLLLFGDASFDYRNIKGGENSNFVPVYETDNSESPLDAFPADDFFALLDDDEGVNLRGALDIAVGRIPVKTNQEARQVVDKIINYETNPTTLGDWRNRLAFVADDEDGNLHITDTDRDIAKLAKNQYPNFNQEKIYLDAFPQVSTAGGEAFPLATEAIDKNIFKGVLALNYLGHGGSKGWAQERVLDKDRGDIRNWDNFDKLPVFITATCSFTGFDDRNQVTAGEEVLLTPDGGGIALYSTVRGVFANSNAALVEAVFDTMFTKINGELPTLGQIMQFGKNSTSIGNGTNSRKFMLFGDPALQLALPRYNVQTTRINSQDLQASKSDTLRALQKVTIEGEVRDDNGQLLTNFNGEVFPTIFDKEVNYTTLAQDPRSDTFNFVLQKNIIFKGRASVRNGQFKFTFVVPKDINFTFGKGRISYYAADKTSMVDAAGSYEEIIIGGTDPDAQADDQGPQVDVFMNTEDFVFGSITNENPTLLVKLADDNGINVAGNSIGHDLEGILNENTKETIILNDFYEAELDDYTRGEVRYPLNELEDGRYQIRVRAWDVANNVSEGYTEFVVASTDEVALKHVLNYPNPFVNSTCFQFEHNLADQELEVLINIYTISGRLVKTLEKRIFADGFIVANNNCIEWDGTDDFGDQLARGVYLYRVNVRAVNTGDIDLTGESNFEKLVILK